MTSKLIQQKLSNSLRYDGRTDRYTCRRRPSCNSCLKTSEFHSAPFTNSPLPTSAEDTVHSATRRLTHQYALIRCIPQNALLLECKHMARHVNETSPDQCVSNRTADSDVNCIMSNETPVWMGIHTRNCKGQFYTHRSQIRGPSSPIVLLINGGWTNPYVMFNTNVFLDEFVLVGHEAAFSRCFEETYCVHLQGPRGPTSKNFETSETDYSATRRRVPGERNTQAYGRENHDTRTGIW